MSRIGNKPVVIPEKVELNISGNKISVKGPKGELFTEVVDDRIQFAIKENELIFSRSSSVKVSRFGWMIILIAIDFLPFGMFSPL